MNLVAVLQGLLFIVGEDGLEVEKAEEILEIDYDKLKILIEELIEICNKDNSGLKLVVLGNKLKFTTKQEHHEYYEKLALEEQGLLSQAALETLAIIAYNQPITRVKVDEIRGINSQHMIRRLLSRDLIEEAGKSEDPGRPRLYVVTTQFLDYFGLASIEDLPKMEEMKIEDNETDLFESKYKEELEDIIESDQDNL